MADQTERIVTQHRVWEDWAQADPLWAIMSDPARRGNKWKLDEFFQTGVDEIDELIAELDERGLAYGHGRAMDFGCGVGRLTQALADKFDECDGVDISETMIDLAREYNRHGESCHYHVNVAPDLTLLPEAGFDLIYSALVLQHNSPDMAQRYIAEFIRLLKPGGLAVFDMPDTPGGTAVRLPDHSHSAALKLLGGLPALTAGASQTITVAVTNTSPNDWPEGHIVKVGNHWKIPDGALLTLDDGRTRLPTALGASAQLSIELLITAPATPGRYRLEIDLVEEGVTWFAGAGSPVLTSDVTVKASGDSRWSRLKRKPAVQPTAAAKDEPEAYEMNSLPFAVVKETIEQAGGTLAQTRLSERAGAEWLTHRYFVTRDALSASAT